MTAVKKVRRQGAQAKRIEAYIIARCDDEGRSIKPLQAGYPDFLRNRHQGQNKQLIVVKDLFLSRKFALSERALHH
jgi:hypothetical protein